MMQISRRPNFITYKRTPDTREPLLELGRALDCGRGLLQRLGLRQVAGHGLLRQVVGAAILNPKPEALVELHRPKSPTAASPDSGSSLRIGLRLQRGQTGLTLPRHLRASR